MQQLHLPGDESALSSAAPSRVIPLPSEPSSPPPPPPIPLNPPSRLAPGVAPGQLSSSRGSPVVLPRSVFSSVRLPRTSSLLPPPHPSTPTPRSPSPVAAAATAYTQHFHTHRDSVHPPVSLKRPSTPSSQTDKGGLTGASPREGSRVRNRWSTSTVSSTSSRTSPFASHQSHTRRASIESIAFNGSPPPSRRNRMPSISTNLSTNPATLPTTKSEAIASRSTSPNPQTSARMPYDQGRDRYVPRSHSRDRNGRGSNDLGKGRAQKPPSQKAMLSRALQKANTAVQLDNAQNFQGARLAYSEACDLLHQVLQRTTADEDKRKLEAIRRTYTSRIEDLDQMGPWEDDTIKALPARPESEDHEQDAYTHRQREVHTEAPKIETARRISIMGSHNGPYSRVPTQQQQQNNGYIIDVGSERQRPSQPQEQGFLQSSFSRAPVRLRSSDELQKPSNDTTYAPPPLNTIRSPSPLRTYGDEAANSTKPDPTSSLPSHPESQEAAKHPRDGGQNSWLDPIDESGGSTSSSVHSRTSSLGYRRRDIRPASGNTENEFDTALDAAIEAAYNDGYDLAEMEEYNPVNAGEEGVMSALRKAEMGGKLRKAQPSYLQQRREQHSTATGFYEDDSSEEEERLLEEITRDFAIEDFTMEQLQNPLVAREPDADAEIDSNPVPGVRSFSALSEKPPTPNIPKTSQPAAPPPKQALPELPPKGSSSPAQSVRSRRISGQNWKPLKIETTNLGPPPRSSHGESLSQTKSAITADKSLEPPAELPVRPASAQQGKSLPTTDSSPSEPQGISSPLGKGKPADKDDSSAAGSSSPSVNKLRKNFSSSSLRSLKNRNMSLSNLDEGSDMSPGTPSSNHFGRMPALPALPTPLAAAFKDTMDLSVGGGLHLFDDNFHMPATPGSPNPMFMDGPVPLEPCPTEPMLRPFWLMRCLFQTLVHPRGGYLSTKLFVPRDVWRVKGVKIKNVEDKIANCDYLTAALLKLAKVDTFDADAMLEEMQSLEGVLEQTQTALTRKLGNEVGVQGSGMLFKDASLAMDGDGGSSVPRSSSVSGKSSFSWRRLRPKTSGVGLGGARIGGTEAKDLVTLPTLPMTARPTTRPAKRDLTQAQFIGPNANYMDSLARLFDAAQAIDQIARQVEDPGLKHADKTQVGLELCTRHAAEFFGLYICRFVLADLGLLLDKFIKRGSEWVLA